MSYRKRAWSLQYNMLGGVRNGGITSYRCAKRLGITTVDVKVCDSVTTCALCHSERWWMYRNMVRFWIIAISRSHAWKELGSRNPETVQGFVLCGLEGTVMLYIAPSPSTHINHRRRFVSEFLLIRQSRNAVPKGTNTLEWRFGKNEKPVLVESTRSGGQPEDIWLTSKFPLYQI